MGPGPLGLPCCSSVATQRHHFSVNVYFSETVKYGRKIAICGRSMMNMIETAQELGYINMMTKGEKTASQPTHLNF